jgi:DegV family protein with EDD domain
MSKVMVVTDSSAYLPEALLQQYDIRTVPLSIIWEGKTYLDGVDIKPNDFYRRLATSRSMPTTSQVTEAAMADIFNELLDQEKKVLGIFISSKFSGTVESALKAAESLPRAVGRIAICDSLLTTMAMGWPVLAAARAAQAGEDLPACQKVAEQARDHSGVLFVVETLEFLRRGGRIGGAQALLGTVLNIKPVLQMNEGRIESLEKVRTKAKALARILDLVAERIGARKPIRLAITHANAEEEALAYLETCRQRLAPVESLCCPLSPVIGTHAGPGTISLNYMAGMD